jgi:hypothetical protein
VLRPVQKVLSQSAIPCKKKEPKIRVFINAVVQMRVAPVDSITNDLGFVFLNMCAHLGSCPKLEAGIYGRVRRLRQP